MIKIRTANVADAQLLADHNCAMALETEGKILDAQAAIAGAEGLFERPQFGFYIVAEVREPEASSSVAATLLVTYEWSDWRNGLFWWIQSVYVKAEFRRQGIYTEMYRQLQEMAAASPTPVCGFRLYAETENTAAQATYKNCGMKACDYIMFEQETGLEG
jgi:ribosomal protein S18 acetylase RimI-like enzyme